VAIGVATAIMRVVFMNIPFALSKHSQRNDLREALQKRAFGFLWLLLGATTPSS